MERETSYRTSRLGLLPEEDRLTRRCYSLTIVEPDVSFYEPEYRRGPDRFTPKEEVMQSLGQRTAGAGARCENG